MPNHKLIPLVIVCLVSVPALGADSTEAPPVVKEGIPAPPTNPTAAPIRPSTLTAIDKGELLGHIQYLSSAEFNGREAGTADQLKVAEYIAGEFKRYGLEPFGDEVDGKRGYFQQFPMPVYKGVVKDAAFKFTVADKETVGAINKQFVIIPAGYKSCHAEGAVAFAGYGILAPDVNYDDFANLDLAGKWALVLRYHPQEFMEKGIFKGRDAMKHAALKEKVMKCALRRAAGVMIVTGPEGREKDKDEALLGKGIGTIIGDFTIPVLQITQEVANQLLAPTGKTIGSLQAAINKDLSNQSMQIPGTKVSASYDIEVLEKMTYNVIARVEGSDPVLKNECVIIGAHCDHVGMGYEGSLLGKDGAGKMHPGADDNASGTAGLLEIAQYMGSLKVEERPKRSVLLIAFSGEERGLLGSAFYCDHPKMPLKDTAAMLNLDMIGRSSDGGTQVSGVGSSRMFRELVMKDAADSNLKIHLGSAGDGPSDHASFFHKKIPVLFFFTGTHADYHRPTDTWDKINAPVAAETANLALKVLKDLGSRPDRPQFSEVHGKSYLGIGVDDVRAKKMAGYPVGAVGAGSPAERAGIEEGDLITSLNGQLISLPMDLNIALAEYSPGDEIELEVQQGKRARKIRVTLGTRVPKD